MTDINRWHASTCHALRNSGDTVDAHSNRMICALIQYNPPGVDLGKLALAIAVHDKGESGVGDICAEAKRENPELAAKLDQVEWERRRQLGLEMPSLTPLEARWLRFLDRHDALQWMMAVAPWEAERPEWVAARKRLHEMANALGV
jgi:5'-deoxynucleotidase YfbR-like HD superfamily hydrolase